MKDIIKYNKMQDLKSYCNSKVRLDKPDNNKISFNVSVLEISILTSPYEMALSLLLHTFRQPTLKSGAAICGIGQGRQP